jgi:hypothetical protein
MDSGHSTEQPIGDHDFPPRVTCTDCKTALQSHGDIAFLLLDQVTAPIAGCDTHQAEFASVCGYATVEPATTVGYRPAGGIACPSCRLAVHTPEHPLVPVSDGVIGIIACPEHQTQILNRFHTGLETKQQVTETDVLADSPDVF